MAYGAASGSFRFKNYSRRVLPRRRVPAGWLAGWLADWLRATGAARPSESVSRRTAPRLVTLVSVRSRALARASLEPIAFAFIRDAIIKRVKAVH